MRSIRDDRDFLEELTTSGALLDVRITLGVFGISAGIDQINGEFLKRFTGHLSRAFWHGRPAASSVAKV